MRYETIYHTPAHKAHQRYIAERAQRNWEFAAAQHARLTELINKYGHLDSAQWARKRIAELETQYPQLKA